MDSSVIFDRSLVRRRRDRAAFRFSEHAFLFEEIAERLIERLRDIKIPLHNILDLGAHNGMLSQKLRRLSALPRIVASELSPALSLLIASQGIPVVCADEEKLPFAPKTFDAVLSNLSLHWVNDVPGSLIQTRHTLKPNGFFLASILGGQTLCELRESLIEAEEEVTSGVSPRFSPLIQLQDAAALLQRAGFAMPVVDHDTITVTYTSPLELLKDLRGTGAANAIGARSRKPLPRSVFLKALQHYTEHHAEKDGRVRATFQVLYLAGWAPA